MSAGVAKLEADSAALFTLKNPPISADWRGTSGADAFAAIAAIEAVLSWSKFESTVAEAQTLAQPEEFDFLALLGDRYGSVRKFALLLLEHFEFHAAPTATELLQALDVLRELNSTGKRTLPEKMPTGFVKLCWQPYVFAVGGVDRHFYEICALAELRDRLRAGAPQSG